MLVAGRRQQLTQIVFDHSLTTDRHFVRERCAYAAVAVWRLVRPQPRRRLNVERFREDGLIVRMRRLDIGDDLRRWANV